MIKKIFVNLIKFYQRIISPFSAMLFGGTVGCRFYPTCSQYAIESITELGIIKGGAKSMLRIARCNPLFEGGVDLPTAQKL